ncbi:type VI secretion system contractile sheath large subunit [Rhizobium beringeri]
MTLAMPRVLARMPYGPKTSPIEEFNFDETGGSKTGELSHGSYCWMNAAYVMGTRLTEAFAKNGWCTAIRGAENGGKVEGLPMHIFSSDDGDLDLKCPTEVGITDRRDAELGKLGFLPLCHYKNTDYAVFFGAQTAHKPKLYDRPEATANAAVSARLPYMMATSRFAHYLKVMGRDKIGSFMEAEDCEAWLNRWISNYVNANDDAGEESRAKYPLREAKVTVQEIPGRPGASQRRGLDAPVAADGGIDHLAAHGRPDSLEELMKAGPSAAGGRRAWTLRSKHLCQVDDGFQH